MTLSTRLAALERSLPSLSAAGRGWLSDPCPGCTACVYIFHPILGASGSPGAGVGMCTLCQTLFVTAAGMAYILDAVKRDPAGPLAWALHIPGETPEARIRAEMERAMAAALELLGVPGPTAAYWREEREAAVARLRATQARETYGRRSA